MNFILEAIEKALGLSPPNGAIAGVVIGMLMVLLAMVLIARLLASLHYDEEEGGQQLMPTLAEEVLDADLRAIYRRSLRLDARLFNALHAWPEGNPDPGGAPTPAGSPRVGETGSALGRALRKLLLSMQAMRFARRGEDEPHAQKNKPPFSEACYELMNQVLDEALALDPSASDIDPLLDKLSAEVEQARREFEERVADHDIASDPQRVP